jgi:hypothetical protein
MRLKPQNISFCFASYHIHFYVIQSLHQPFEYLEPVYTDAPRLIDHCGPKSGLRCMALENSMHYFIAPESVVNPPPGHSSESKLGLQYVDTPRKLDNCLNVLGTTQEVAPLSFPSGRD